jgi:MATE family multidrug resistance protein
MALFYVIIDNNFRFLLVSFKLTQHIAINPEPFMPAALQHTSTATPPQIHLTPHKPGSVRELWRISLPLMLTALSGSLMLFCDRLILARYSIEAMNAASTAGMAVAVFQFGAVSIAAIAEVFVGQYNGAKKQNLLGEPVWQMIWFSCLTLLAFLPLGLFASQWFLPPKYSDLGTPYFMWLMIFGPLLPMISAVAAFYIGQGLVKLVTIAALFGNLINLVLGIMLVFGVPKLGIPAMSTEGAAIATVIAQSIQFAILFVVFLNHHHRKNHGTGHYKFNRSMFFQCIRIGLPSSIGHMIEIGAWAAMAYMLSWVSERHVTLLAIGQSIYILFAFASDGLQKGVIAVTSNFIGAKQLSMVRKVLRSAVILSAYIIAVLAIPLLISPEWVVNSFIPSTLPGPELIELRALAELTLFWIWIYFVFDIVVWVLAGILTAAGDTAFIMLINAVNAWFFALIPVYFFVVKMNGPAILTWKLSVLYISINMLCFFWRYRSNKWKRLHLVA